MARNTVYRAGSHLYLAKQLVDLLETIRPDDECWEWPYGKASSGYGQLQFAGKHMTVHRVVFYLTHGHWPHPVARHTCDNRACFNPQHIIEGTHMENCRDALDRQRLVCGERSMHAKITADIVREIRSRYLRHRGTGHKRSGENSCGSLAKEFGISPSNVCDIAYGRTWRHI